IWALKPGAKFVYTAPRCLSTALRQRPGTMNMIPSQLQPDQPPPGYLRIADLLGALSLAADLTMGLPAAHAIRSCYLGMHIAERLQLPSDHLVGLYYAELLMDVGCTAWTSQLAASIMGDEMVARREFYFYTDARNPIEVFNWLRHYVADGQPARVRASRLL